MPDRFWEKEQDQYSNYQNKRSKQAVLTVQEHSCSFPDQSTNFLDLLGTGSLFTDPKVQPSGCGESEQSNDNRYGKPVHVNPSI